MAIWLVILGPVIPGTFIQSSSFWGLQDIQGIDIFSTVTAILGLVIIQDVILRFDILGLVILDLVNLGSAILRFVILQLVNLWSAILGLVILGLVILGLVNLGSVILRFVILQLAILGFVILWLVILGCVGESNNLSFVDNSLQDIKIVLVCDSPTLPTHTVGEGGGGRRGIGWGG